LQSNELAVEGVINIKLLNISN